MNTTPLVTFHNVEPARVLRDRLQQSGIPAVIYDESKFQRLWFMSSPFAAVHVEVPQTDYLKANQLVVSWDHQDRCLSEAVRCPECFSSRVEFPQVSRKFVSPAILISVLSRLGIIERRFYCTDCHYTWPVAVRVSQRRDVPGFPLDSELWDARRAGHH